MAIPLSGIGHDWRMTDRWPIIPDTQRAHGHILTSLFLYLYVLLVLNHAFGERACFSKFKGLLVCRTKNLGNIPWYLVLVLAKHDFSKDKNYMSTWTICPMSKSLICVSDWRWIKIDLYLYPFILGPSRISGSHRVSGITTCTRTSH